MLLFKRKPVNSTEKNSNCLIFGINYCKFFVDKYNRSMETSMTSQRSDIMSDFYGIGSGNSSYFNDFFGSSSTQSSSGSSGLTDYNLIKSGTYKKMLKSYYSSSSEKTTTESAEAKAAKQSLVQTKSVGKALNEAATALKNLKEEDFTDKDALSSKVGTFVSAYNDVIETTGDSDVKSVLQKTLWMIGGTNTSSKVLNELGITVGKDNKLSFNADTFKKADVSAMKTMFGGNSSFMGKVASKAADLVSLSNNALNATAKATGYNNKGDFKSVDTSTLYNDLF